MQFVFLDEHPDSILSPAFWLSPALGRDAMIISYPGALHKGAATISFADGRVESKRWIDPRTKPPAKGAKYLGESDSPNNPDIQWLQQRTFFPTE